MQNLTQFKAELDQHLTNHLQQKLQTIRDTIDHPTINDAFASVPSLLAGGKRIRPFLIQLGYEAYAPAGETTLTNLAIGMELFHLFCLVHDDIIDRAPSRRGSTTVHTHVQMKSGADDPQYGNHQAILVGDLLYAWATDLMLQPAYAPARTEVMRMIDQVVLGQMLDVQQTSLTDTPSKEGVLKKMELKTASYTFVQPFCIGLTLSSAAHLKSDALVNFLCDLGVTFQQQDDYLDYFLESTTIGKQRLKDFEEGQHTLVWQEIVATLPAAQANTLQALHGQQLTPDQRQHVISILDASDVKRNINNEITSQYESLLKTLPTLGMREPVAQMIAGLIQQLINRNA